MSAIAECTLSHHAQQRCHEMDVTVAEVASALVDAELTYPSPPKYGAGRQISVAGRLAVVHHHNNVITVLWHRREGRVLRNNAVSACAEASTRAERTQTENDGLSWPHSGGVATK